MAAKYKTVEISIDGVVKKFKSKTRIMMNIAKDIKELNALIDKPPTKEESIRFISAGGFSLISFIKYISETENIKEMYVSSLTIGRKHMLILDNLFKTGKLGKISFVFCGIFKQSNNSSYNYFDTFEKICKKNGWEYFQINNHSKILLMETDKNYYVIETSSNLNENPKIEQFTFENDVELYNFYRDFFIAIKNNS